MFQETVIAKVIFNCKTRDKVSVTNDINSFNFSTFKNNLSFLKLVLSSLVECQEKVFEERLNVQDNDYKMDVPKELFEHFTDKSEIEKQISYLEKEFNQLSVKEKYFHSDLCSSFSK